MTDPNLPLSSRLRALTEELNEGRLTISKTESMALVAPDPRGFAFFKYFAQSLDLLIPACEVLEQQVKDLEARIASTRLTPEPGATAGMGWPHADAVWSEESRAAWRAFHLQHGTVTKEDNYDACSCGATLWK